MSNRFRVTSKDNEYTFVRDHKSDSLTSVFIDDESLFESDSDEIVISKDLGIHPIFRVVDGSEEYHVGQRTLPISGMNNFRDMGGYKSNTGQTVKWGKLFRSDHIHNANEEGLKSVNELQIKSIVDFRSDDEISKYPNPQLDSSPTSIQLDPRAHAAELSAQFTAPKQDEDVDLIKNIVEQKDNGNLQNRNDMIIEQYDTFVYGDDSKEAFKQLLLIAAEDNAAPLVQHCRGGKDRTGFGALLILGALGVSEEDIVKDYMITEENRLDRNKVKMDGYEKITQDKEVLDYLFSLIETRDNFIKHSIERIHEKYDSIRDYVKIELDINEETLKKLEDLYLE